MHLSEALESFLLYQRQRKGRSVTTISTYRSSLGAFVDWSGDILLSELTPGVVDNYANHILQFNYAQKTYRNKLTPIRSMVKHFYSKGDIDMRPEAIDLPPIENVEANFLTEDEQQSILKACRTPLERAIFLVLLRSGVRVSELVNLRYDDLHDRSIIVRRGKGGKARITFLTERAQEAVSDLHKTLPNGSVWLVCSQTGKQITRQYVNRIIKNIALRARIKKTVSPHTMRHTCATNLLRAGARVEDVQKILGHANIQTTLIYMHFTNDYLKSRYDLFTKESTSLVLTK